MTNPHRTIAALCGVLLLALCGFLAMGPRSVTTARAGSRAATPHLTRAADTAVPTCRMPTDEAQAYCLFGKLTHANQTWEPGHPPPGWTGWLGKCELGLATTAACGEQTTASKGGNHLLPADLASGTRPVQSKVAADARPAQEPDEVAEQTSTHAIASVLYSPNIAWVIHTHHYNEKLTPAPIDAALPPPGNLAEISIGAANPSIVTKLVWEVVVSGSLNAPAFIYTPDVQRLVVAPNQLTAVSNWPRYLIDGDESKPCPEGVLPQPSMAHPPTVPVNCFFHYRIDTTNKSVMNALTGDLKNEVETAKIPPDQSAFIILMGAHMMSLDTAHPLWQWMTFFWMNTQNPAAQSAANSGGTGVWKNPWGHYQMETTSIAKELSTALKQPVFNPYLEGHIDPNGLQTNCISCHSLAAYSATHTKVTDAITLIDGPRLHPGDGVPGYPESLQAALKPAADAPQGYFTGAIRTHFLWSLATNPNLAASPSQTSSATKTN